MAFLKTSLSVSKAHFRVPGSSTGEKWNQSPAPNVCAFDKKVNEISLKLQSVLVFLPVSACTSGRGGEGRGGQLIVKIRGKIDDKKKRINENDVNGYQLMGVVSRRCHG